MELILWEKYRPRAWSDVVGQPGAVAQCEAACAGGKVLGRGWWITGGPGQGKTTIARLLAAAVASKANTVELDGGSLSVSMVNELVGQHRRVYALFPVAVIVNEAHNLKPLVLARLKGELDPCPASMVWLFTTTVEEQGSLFAAYDKDKERREAPGPFLARTIQIRLARRDVKEPYARRAMDIATAEGLNGRPFEAYLRLAHDYANNLRAMLSAVEAGVMRAPV